MSLDETFESFFDAVYLEGPSAYQPTIGTIFKKLNSHYYGCSSESDHGYIVGSVGRGTAVLGTSDVDLLFDLPPDVCNRFDSYDGNGQSKLLQDVKNVIKERYPRTDVKGDGQAVVVSFESLPFTVDLVPAFKQEDGWFKYPDSNDGGSWKKTDPISEQDACDDEQIASSGWFRRLCNTLRVWKNNEGFRFKGLLIDALVGKFIDGREDICDIGIDLSYGLIRDLMEELSKENANQAYWHAIGSNQLIYNDDAGKFVQKAARALGKLDDATTDEEREQALCDLLGKTFEDCLDSAAVEEDHRRLLEKYSAEDSEQFIETLCPVDIRHNVKIDCDVTQKGFRAYLLRDMLRKRLPLLPRKCLEFMIVECDVPEPYEIRWKVKNCGEIAYSRNCIRGQINSGGRRIIEHTVFRGDHYVEIYILRAGACVARDRISVPIVSG